MSGVCASCGAEFLAMGDYARHVCEGSAAKPPGTLPLAVLHQKARDRIAELEAELRHVDTKRQELVRLRNWVAWLEREPEAQRT